jgi:hypothetical protein
MKSKMIVRALSMLCVLVVGLVPLFSYAELSSSSTSLEKEKLHSYFSDSPAMKYIAECESGARQYTDDGTVLRGGAGNKMVGMFQLHETYHRAPALLLGFDIDTLEGNLGYAEHLYTQEGLTPWAPCLHAIPDTISKETTLQTPELSLSKTEKDSLVLQIKNLERKLLMLKVQLLTQRLETLKSL